MIDTVVDCHRQKILVESMNRGYYSILVHPLLEASEAVSGEAIALYQNSCKYKIICNIVGPEGHISECPRGRSEGLFHSRASILYINYCSCTIDPEA
jgi:hypothetical protein